MTSIAVLFAASALAQPPALPDAVAVDAAPADAPADVAPPTPVAPDEDAAVAPGAAVDATVARDDQRTIAERGGLFGVGVSIAPKLGGGLGSLLLANLGAGLTTELEVGYALPLDLPRGRDLVLFTSIGYAAATSGATIDANDPRLPGGGDFTYGLVMHQLPVHWGALYRLPLDVVPWWRPYASLGARTLWSWTVIDGEAGGQAFGAYTESAFDLGGYGALGSEFYLGPGAVLVELQGTLTGADRYVLRDAVHAGLQLAVGYRLML